MFECRKIDICCAQSFDAFAKVRQQRTGQLPEVARFADRQPTNNNNS